MRTFICLSFWIILSENKLIPSDEFFSIVLALGFCVAIWQDLLELYKGFKG